MIYTFCSLVMQLYVAIYTYEVCYVMLASTLYTRCLFKSVALEFMNKHDDLYEKKRISSFEFGPDLDSVE